MSTFCVVRWLSSYSPLDFFVCILLGAAESVCRSRPYFVLTDIIGGCPTDTRYSVTLCVYIHALENF